MKRGNKGYTLVEFLVVMSILSIVAVAGFSIIGYLTGTKAKSAAYNIQSGLGKARIETMSKSRGKLAKDIYFAVTLDSNNKDYYMELYNTRVSEDVPISRELIGNTRINIYGEYVANSLQDHLGKEPGDKRQLRFYFERSTGGLMQVDDSEYYETIRVVQGNVSYQIIIAPLTGKVSLERVF